VVLCGREHPIAAVLRRARRRDALREGDDALVLREVQGRCGGDMGRYGGDMGRYGEMLVLREVRLPAAAVQPLLLEQQP